MNPITIANSFARGNGYGVATQISIGDEFKIIERVDFGYRKYTTGQYVSNTYRNHFGWKNTYYQHAITHVEVPIEIFTAWENEQRR